MKKISITLLLVFLSILGFGQTANPSYDQELATKLGADDYGMKSYAFVILKTGPNSSTDKAFVDSCFRGHFENMNRMVEDGKLVVAGPFSRNEKSYRGIFILDTTDSTEVQRLLNSDPSINEGLLEAEVYGWYGSAALREYLEASDKVWRLKP